MNAPHSITPIVQESERVIQEAVQHFGLKVKPADICVTVQSKGRKNAVGWFWGESWKNKTEKFHEINLCAEFLTQHDMGELILHELAHAENKTLGIKDCANRLHNKHFKSMAERLGLEVKPRDKAVGFGYTDLAPAGSEFLKKIAFKRDVYSSFRCGESKKAKPGSRLLKCECPECGYTVRVTQKWLDVGNPVCPCGEEMGQMG